MERTNNGVSDGVARSTFFYDDWSQRPQTEDNTIDEKREYTLLNKLKKDESNIT